MSKQGLSAETVAAVAATPKDQWVKDDRDNWYARFDGIVVKVSEDADGHYWVSVETRQRQGNLDDAKFLAESVARSFARAIKENA